MEKDKRIKREVTRLNRIFKDIAKDRKSSVTSLISNAAFMTITLEDLQVAINENGTISEYKNGENQFGTKKSPEVEVYNTMIKNHCSIIKQLSELLPKIEPKPADDGFDDFVGNRDD